MYPLNLLCLLETGQNDHYLDFEWVLVPVPVTVELKLMAAFEQWLPVNNGHAVFSPSEITIKMTVADFPSSVTSA